MNPNKRSLRIHASLWRNLQDEPCRWMKADPSKGVSINFTRDDFFDTYSCSCCPEEFDNKPTFEAHTKDRHLRNYYCRHCQVEFSDRKGLMESVFAEFPGVPSQLHLSSLAGAGIADSGL